MHSPQPSAILPFPYTSPYLYLLLCPRHPYTLFSSIVCLPFSSLSFIYTSISILVPIRPSQSSVALERNGISLFVPFSCPCLPVVANISRPFVFLHHSARARYCSSLTTLFISQHCSSYTFQHILQQHSFCHSTCSSHSTFRLFQLNLSHRSFSHNAFIVSKLFLSQKLTYSLSIIHLSLHNLSLIHSPSTTLISHNSHGSHNTTFTNCSPHFVLSHSGNLTTLVLSLIITVSNPCKKPVVGYPGRLDYYTKHLL